MVKPDFDPNVLLLGQYLRWLPAHLGIMNYGAFRLQIKKIRPDDRFLVSYPKSGNTWLRYIVATALHGRSNFTFDELEQIVPDVYLSKNKINRSTTPRIIKTHDALFEYYPLSIYIYRDVRDVMVSYYHYAVNAREFSGSIHDFIRGNYVQRPFGAWAQHVQKAVEAKNKGEKIHLVKYEDLLCEPEKEIRAILEYMQLKPVIPIQQVAEYCAFKVLQQHEKEKGSYFGNQALFFRQGESGQASKQLSPGDADYLLNDPLTAEMMKTLHYNF